MSLIEVTDTYILYALNSDFFFFALQNCKKWLLASSFLSVYLRGTTWLPLDGFLGNLIFEDCLKICWENSSLIKY